jgi:hypothetical protein
MSQTRGTYTKGFVYFDVSWSPTIQVDLCRDCMSKRMVTFLLKLRCGNAPENTI